MRDAVKYKYAYPRTLSKAERMGQVQRRYGHHAMLQVREELHPRALCVW
jgi:hypothetical protein